MRGEDWGTWADPLAEEVQSLRTMMGLYATAKDPGTQSIDVLLYGARNYRKKITGHLITWSPEVVKLALVDGAQLGDGWIVREIPGKIGVLTLVRR